MTAHYLQMSQSEAAPRKKHRLISLFRNIDKRAFPVIRLMNAFGLVIYSSVWFDTSRETELKKNRERW